MPAERMTSWRARATWTWPSFRYSTPTARVPSNTTRVACAFGLHGEIAPMHHGPQESARDVSATAARHDHFIALQAFAVLAVEVVGYGIACREGGRAQFLVHEVVFGDAHFERALAAVILALAQPAALRKAEVGQDIRVAPAGESGACPVVVVEAMAARVHHAVDSRTAAQGLAARHLDDTVVGVRLGLALEIPVEIPAQHVAREGDRHVLEHAGGWSPRLEQQHRGVRLGAEAMREHAAGGTGADDH